MPTPTVSLRIPPDLKAEADRARKSLSFTDFTVAALRAYLGQPGPADTRVQVLEAEVARLRLRLAKVTAAAGGAASEAPVPGPGTPAFGPDVFARILQDATEAFPASYDELKAVSGHGHTWVDNRLAALIWMGQIRRLRIGKYVPRPGSDVLAALDRITARPGRLMVDGQVISGPGAAPGQAPEPGEVPRKPPAARTRPSADVRARPEMPAAQDRAGALTAVRERAAGKGLDLKPASALTVPAHVIPEHSPGTVLWKSAEDTEAKVEFQVPGETPDPARKRSRPGQSRCNHHVPVGTRCKICPR